MLANARKRAMALLLTFAMVMGIEKTPEGYANDATSANGTWTVHVGKDGEVLVSKEPNAQGFFYNIYNWIVETVTGTKGSLDVVKDAEGNPTVTITNTRQTGSLTIEKAISGDIRTMPLPTVVIRPRE